MMLAVVGIPSREARPSGSDEDTLSPKLRTAGLLRPHVWVGYQWSHTGFCPGCKASHNRSIRSFVSQPPQNRTRELPLIRLKPWTPKADPLMVLHMAPGVDQALIIQVVCPTSVLEYHMVALYPLAGDEREIAQGAFVFLSLMQDLASC